MLNRKNALLSVYHKDGITDFARGLTELDWTVYASGGTAKHLEDAGVPVTNVAALTGGGAILGHRVVTLSREVFACILATESAEDQAELARLNLPWIDLVCVDLYPIEDEIRRPGATLASVREKTDIGGPALLRAAAKGERIVICDPDDRDTVLFRLQRDQPEEPDYRLTLAAKAEETAATYAQLSAVYLGSTATTLAQRGR